jgi:hypothetical protein
MREMVSKIATKTSGQFKLPSSAEIKMAGGFG